MDSSFAADSIIINDNDLPTVSIVASTPNATESSGSPGEFTVTRTGPTGQPLTVYYSWGSYAPLYASTDYQPLSGNVTIPAGQNSATIAVNPIAATGGPGGGIQPLTASLSTNPSNPSSYWISNENTAIVNFYGPLTPPILAYYADQPVTSPGSSTPAQFTIVCSTVAPSTVYYRVFAGPNGLVDGVDYSVEGQSSEEYHTATIPAGGSAVVSIDALTPAAAGCSFYLLLESPLSPYWQSYMGMGYSAVLYPLPTVAVAPIPTPELAVSDAVAVEGDAEVFTVRLSASATQSVSVPYSTWDGSAVSTGSGEIDYASTSGSVTVAPGGTAQITVPTDVGWLGGGDKGFTLDLGSVSGVSIPNNWAVGIMTPVTATVSLRTDYNDDGAVGATDDFFSDVDPTPVYEPSYKPPTELEINFSFNAPVQNASGWTVELKTSNGTGNCVFSDAAAGGNQLSPDGSGVVERFSVPSSGVFAGKAWMYGDIDTAGLQGNGGPVLIQALGLEAASTVVSTVVLGAAPAGYSVSPTPRGIFTVGTGIVHVGGTDAAILGKSPWAYTVSYSLGLGSLPADLSGGHIVLVQALENPTSHLASVQVPHFDSDKAKTYYGHQILPEYLRQGYPSGFLTFSDRPYEEVPLYSLGAYTWTMTVAADYQVVNPATGKYSDYILGCVTFTWYDALGGGACITIPGVPWLNGKGSGVTIKEPVIQNYRMPAVAPNALWNSALTNW